MQSPFFEVYRFARYHLRLHTCVLESNQRIVPVGIVLPSKLTQDIKFAPPHRAECSGTSRLSEPSTHSRSLITQAGASHGNRTRTACLEGRNTTVIQVMQVVPPPEVKEVENTDMQDNRSLAAAFGWDGWNRTSGYMGQSHVP